MPCISPGSPAVRLSDQGMKRYMPWSDKASNLAESVRPLSNVGAIAIDAFIGVPLDECGTNDSCIACLSRSHQRPEDGVTCRRWRSHDKCHVLA